MLHTIIKILIIALLALFAYVGITTLSGAQAIELFPLAQAIR
ncbi:MAG: hypothetical protein ACPG70_06160 [Candidatus Puniceispirillaceae bacterium]|jgi:hypothetical protein